MANPPPLGGGMSLYADLLDGGSSADKTADKTAPAQEPASTSKDAPKPTNPALRFQPVIRRPQQNKAKAKPKLPQIPASIPPSTASTAATTTTTMLPSIAFAPANRTTLADWTGGDDDDYYDNSNSKWQRGGRKRKKKGSDHRDRDRERDAWVDWDEIYDPTRPTNLEAYMHSDERVAAAIEWKGVLYAHRRGTTKEDTESSEDERPQNRAFAPPSFAPPSFAPPASYDRAEVSPPPKDDDAKDEPGLVVSKAPVRFEASTTDHDMDDDDDDYKPSFAFDTGSPAESDEAPRSNRPGQAGFAARLMAKYGWTKGTGLGADESGIVNPLRHKRVNAAGSGPAMGRIVGGHAKKAAETASVSPVIVLRNMVGGMADLAAEVADGQLVQEIGEECGEQYGRIERVYVDVASELVFIKFTESVSALRAVNALNGRIFNGSAITPSFYDADKFEAGIYQ